MVQLERLQLGAEDGGEAFATMKRLGQAPESQLWGRAGPCHPQVAAAQCAGAEAGPGAPVHLPGDFGVSDTPLRWDGQRGHWGE